MRWRNVWRRDEKNMQYLQTWRWSVVPNESSRDFGPCDRFGRSWPFAAFCYRPRLPVRHWGRDMSAPKPYETNPTPTHSSKPPLSLQFNVRFRWLIYSRQKSFYLSYGKHWSRRFESARMRPAEGNIHACMEVYFISNFRIISSRHYS